MSDDELASIHEASHAVISFLLGERIFDLHITPHGTGSCRGVRGGRSHAADAAAISLSGVLAERALLNHRRTNGQDKPDIANAARALRTLPAPSAREVVRNTVRLVRAHQHAIRELATALMRQRTMDGPAVEATIIASITGVAPIRKSAG